MKSSFALFTVLLFISVSTFAQQDNRSKRVSPPATVSQTLKNGTNISIDYSQPSLKKRAIGTEIAPYGKVWRTGANEATVFSVTKDVKVEGKALPAGKYSLYTIPGETEWIIIFNRTWKQWGSNYNESDDQLRVSVKPEKSQSVKEQFTIEIAKSGNVSLFWGAVNVNFDVK